MCYVFSWKFFKKDILVKTWKAISSCLISDSSKQVIANKKSYFNLHFHQCCFVTTGALYRWDQGTLCAPSWSLGSCKGPINMVSSLLWHTSLELNHGSSSSHDSFCVKIICNMEHNNEGKSHANSKQKFRPTSLYFLDQ